jgi:tetratricopeptide (TPR) repeat protein
MLIIPACGGKPSAEAPKNEIPADKLEAVLRAHLQGMGAMERYEYPTAVGAFRAVRTLVPGWIPGSINLAIALLNDIGSKSAAVEKANGSSSANYDEALALLDDVIRREPNHLPAHYCRGLILESLGRVGEANREFQLVTERDPNDGHAWYKLGATLMSADDPTQKAGLKEAPRLVEIYTRALECNPYLAPAMYGLQQAYSWAGEPTKQKEVLNLWLRLDPKRNPAAPGDTAEAFYGESGKFARIINPFPPPQPPGPAGPLPRFGAATAILEMLGEGETWVKPQDLTGTLARARARFGATVATFDADGDGRADVFLAAAVKGPKGVRDVLLLNKGEGRFEDASKAWGLPDDRASLGAAAGDFDADRKIDLFLTGLDGNHLLKNDGKRFDDVTEQAGLASSKGLGLTARWLDLDQDGDLDLYIIQYTDRENAGDAFGGGAVPKVVNAAHRNDGRPAPIATRPQDNWAPLAVATPDLPATAGLSLAFTPWPDAAALIGPAANNTGIGALDIDEDRDLDLVLAADGEPLVAVLNDRLGKFHSAVLNEPQRQEPGINGLLVADFDKDGRPDLAAVSSTGRVSAWRNMTEAGKLSRVVSLRTWPTGPKTWTNAIAADLDLDTWPDLVGLDAPAAVGWLRNDGKRLVEQVLPVGSVVDGSPSGFTLADLVSDALPDLLLIPDGRSPQISRNFGNGQHWLALDLGGRWNVGHEHMRTNPQGLGTRINLEGQGLHVTYDHTTPDTGLAQSVRPIVLGLGKSTVAELVRLRWPDGTMQCELNEKADVQLTLAEKNRKTGSCPVLFTWNGSAFVCLGDFLGGGGLGYLVAPGLYSQPDRDESVSITADQLRDEEGVYRLSITEPMDEVAYLDELRLKVIDRAPGVSSTADERFAPEGPRPSGAVIAWKTVVHPEQARDQAGRDVSRVLSGWDRDTVNSFRRLPGWIGYAEEHGIVLDFGDRLSDFDPGDPLILVLAGWVEYPYSQTNYAAATAGVKLTPPCLERLRDDGTWAVIEPYAGYPAGLPRMTTLDVTGKLTGPRCVIRLRTNMECYWDQAFIAIRDRSAEASLRTVTLPVARARLGHRGYTREVSPDGREPLLYDYNHPDAAPLAVMSGSLTRYGDVAALLQSDDDELCVVGPGDEVRIEFDGAKVPALREGWTRSYLLKAVGYCKDADPFTATGDQVGPLPWRGMPEFPFANGVERPSDPRYDQYLRQYQIRPAGAP